METKDVWFVYERQAFGPHRLTDKFIIDSYNFDEECIVHRHQDFPSIKVEGNQFVKLLCRCGSCDFNDDGRWMNEYQCNCCGKYITVFRRDEHVKQEAPNQTTTDH